MTSRRAEHAALYEALRRAAVALAECRAILDTLPGPDARRDPGLVAQVAYSREEAAQLTSLSLETIRPAINRGDLRAKRVGRRIVVLANDLDDWLERQPDY